MADPSLESPAAFRLVAAAAAMVGSLALVALGVQIGTDGLAGFGADRNPASETAAQAAASVAVPRTRPTDPSLDGAMLALVPLGGLVAADVPAAPTTGGGGPTTGAVPSPAPPDGSSGEAPSDPAAPLPVPDPAEPPEPTAPDPSPLLEPLAPVTDPLIDALDPLLGDDDSQSAGSGGGEASEPPASGSTGLLATLARLLGL